MNTRWIGSAALALAVVCVFTGTALGDKKGDRYTKFPEQRFQLSVGGYFAFLDSSVTVGSNAIGLGVTVDTERFLGLDTSQTAFTAFFDAALGKQKRHNLSFSYWNFDRSGSLTVTEDITIDDIDIPIGSTLETNLNFSLFRLKYMYSVVKDKRVEVELGPGLYIMPIEFDTRFSAPGLGVYSETAFDITAPLPVLGLQVKVALTPRLFLYQKLDLMYLKIDDFEGSIIDGDLGLEYQITKHLGIGGGWHGFSLDIDAQGDNYPGIDPIGSFNFLYTGLLLYGSVYF